MRLAGSRFQTKGRGIGGHLMAKEHEKEDEYSRQEVPVDHVVRLNAILPTRVGGEAEGAESCFEERALFGSSGGSSGGTV